MSIYVVRHGETAANAARIVQVPQTPLSQRGIRQAEQLAHRLAGLGVTAVLSSDMRRAVMTADVIGDATGVPIQFDAGLQERNYGDIRGRAYAEIGVDILGPDYDPPGGETWEQFYARVAATWNRVTAGVQSQGNLVIVTHGLVCHALATRHLEINGADAPLRWGNASLTIIDGKAPWRVQLLNCTTHLADDSKDDGTLSGL